MPLPVTIIRLGAIEELRPTVNFSAHADAPGHTVWGPRINPDAQLFYIWAGEAEAQLGRKTYRLGPSDCVLYGPDCPNKLRTLSHSEYVSLHFHWHCDSPEPVHPAYGIVSCSEEELSRYPGGEYDMDFPGSKRLAIPTFMTAPGLESALMRIVHEYRNGQPGYPVVLRALLTELAAALARHQLNRRPPSPEMTKIEPALQAIVKHPEGSWSVSALADLCGYHAIYFSALFKKCTGVTPKQYLIAERIRKAKFFLLQGEKLERIAERLGYASIHYFSRNFKEETGLTPTEFKQQERET